MVLQVLLRHASVVCIKYCKDFVDNYVDDSIIYSADMDTHVSDLERVLSRLGSRYEDLSVSLARVVFRTWV